MDRQIAARTKWVNLYLETQDAGYVCRKCGVSLPTLRKWVLRFQQEGGDGLIEKSKKQKGSSARFPLLQEIEHLTPSFKAC